MAAKFLLKDCPRCKGDRFFGDGDDGPELVCIQCSYRTYLTGGSSGIASMDRKRPRRMTVTVRAKGGLAT